MVKIKRIRYGKHIIHTLDCVDYQLERVVGDRVYGIHCMVGKAEAKYRDMVARKLWAARQELLKTIRLDMADFIASLTFKPGDEFETRQRLTNIMRQEIGEGKTFFIRDRVDLDYPLGRMMVASTKRPQYAYPGPMYCIECIT